MSGATNRPRPSSLGRAHLDGVFDRLRAAHAGDLGGAYRVGLASAPGIDRLPPVWAARVLRAVNLAMPLAYRGKTFRGAGGTNVFAGGLERGRYSLHDGGTGLDTLVIDYDVDANPRALRPLAAPVRVLDDRSFVCRMVWRGRGGRARTVLYFTLVPA